MIFSSGTGGFFSSFGFSAGFSGAACGCCWEKQRPAEKRNSTATLKKRIGDFIGGRTASSAFAKCKIVTCGIVCESKGSVNRLEHLKRPVAKAISLAERGFADRMRTQVKRLLKGAPHAPR